MARPWNLHGSRNRVSCKARNGTSKREKNETGEEFVNKAKGRPLLLEKRTRWAGVSVRQLERGRRSTIRRNRKLPKGCAWPSVDPGIRANHCQLFFSSLSSSSSSPSLSSSSFHLSAGFSFSRRGAIYYGPIRVREQPGNSHGHVFLSANRRHSPGVRPGWKTMLTEMKNRQKFCNCQVWYFAFDARVRPFCKRANSCRAHTLQRIHGSHSGTRISVGCKLATLSTILLYPSRLLESFATGIPLRIHSSCSAIFSSWKNSLACIEVDGFVEE